MSGPVNPIIECSGVAKYYGALAAVDGVDLSVQPGETIGIGGPNGAGKTTFFDLISGITPASTGVVRFNGRAITGVAPHKLFRQGMARTFQVTSGFTSLTVFENMMTSVLYGTDDESFGLLFNKRLRDRVMAQLDAFGLANIAKQTVSDIPTLSRKKLMVASAVVHAPKVLLLDEPVSGLMPGEVDQFIELMGDLRKQGISIVFIEHVMRFLTSVADRAIIMHQGKLIYDGSPIEIAQDQLVKSVYLGSSAENLGAV